MEVVYRETRELVRLASGNYILVVRLFGRKGELVDWRVLKTDKAGFASKEEGNEL